MSTTEVPHDESVPPEVGKIDLYLEGINRASVLLEALRRTVPEHFTMYVKAQGGTEVHSFSDAYFDVATTAADFEERKRFTEQVALLAVTEGLLAVVTPPSALLPSGKVMAWLFGEGIGIANMPGVPGTTKQLVSDLPMVAGVYHADAPSL